VLNVIMDEDVQVLVALEWPSCMAFCPATHSSSSGVAHDPIRFTSRETLAHGGAVSAVDAAEMPSDARVAGVLPY
jgi:hypothetical protein